MGMKKYNEIVCSRWYKIWLQIENYVLGREWIAYILVIPVIVLLCIKIYWNNLIPLYLLPIGLVVAFILPVTGILVNVKLLRASSEADENDEQDYNCE